MHSFRPTSDQKRLIDLVEGSHLVQAPPGTGKTEVLTQRVVTLLELHPKTTFRVLGLTFTTKAAENLRQRVRAVLGASQSERVTACTFHAFCLTALQHYGHFVDFPADTTVYENEDDRLDVLGRALEEEGMLGNDPKHLRQQLVRIGIAKRELRAPPGMEDPELAIAYGAYNRVLRRLHACDFDDLLWLTWKLFAESPKVAKHYRRMYRFIMVDEAQDTSRAQYEILKALCGADHRNVMMVADSDQFIYRFAGASDKWLEAFVKDFGAETHRLIENFRCAAAIIEAASKLAESSPHGTSRMAVAGGKPAPGFVLARSYPNEQAEAEAVVQWIVELLSDGLSREIIHPSETSTVSPEDICVLGRNRYVLTTVVDELRRQSIEVLFRSGRKGLVETPEAELVVQGLRILQNPSDTVTRESVFATWSPENSAGSASVEVDEFFRELAVAAPRVADLCEAFRVASRRPVDVTTLVRSLLHKLEATGTGNGRSEEDWAFMLTADLNTLQERWSQYSGHIGPENRSLGGFLGELALAGQSVIEGPGVRALTVHTAKGLEFKAVALVGMNEGTLPDYRSRDKGDVRDEQRIAYVALTRASRILFITRPRVRQMPWGASQNQEVSRFISGMGLEMGDESSDRDLQAFMPYGRP